MAGRRKKLSEWNEFVAVRRRRGMSMKQIGAEWRRKNNKHAAPKRKATGGQRYVHRKSESRRYTASEWKKRQKAERARHRSFLGKQRYIEKLIRENKDMTIAKAEKRWKGELKRREQSKSAYKRKAAMRIGSPAHKKYLKEREEAREKARYNTSYNPGHAFGSFVSSGASARDRSRRKGGAKKASKRKGKVPAGLKKWHAFLRKHAGKGYSRKTLSRMYRKEKAAKKSSGKR